MRTFLKIIGITILIIVFLVVGILGYLGIFPGVSNLFGSNRPRDLGVKYTNQDLLTAQKKLGQEISEKKEVPLTGGHPVDVTLTQEEYSAHVARIQPVSDFQIKLVGNTFEMSGKIDKSRIPNFVRAWGFTNASDNEILNVVNKYVPGDVIFYVTGTGGANNNDLHIDVSKAELGRLPVPTDQIANIIKLYTDALFKEIPGFYVESSTIEDGHLHFRGTASKEIPNY